MSHQRIYRPSNNRTNWLLDGLLTNQIARYHLAWGDFYHLELILKLSPLFTETTNQLNRSFMWPFPQFPIPTPASAPPMRFNSENFEDSPL